MERAATEKNDLGVALARVPVMEQHVAKFRRRMAPFFKLDPPARVLDVGAAQGVAMVAFQRAGFEAYGVEPFAPAVEVSHEVERECNTTLDIRPGVFEQLPFEDSMFRFVHAYSVLEHVDDPLACLREAYRVLEPGGAFFFSTTSKVSPRQAEIGVFKGFPWYPARLQKTVMDWTMEHRPEWVGHTTRPAIHWFRHRWARDTLRGIGFREVVDQWQLRPAEEREGLGRSLVEAAKRYPVVRVAGDIRVGGMEYLAIK